MYDEDINKELEMRNLWYAKAREQNMDTLPAFLKELLSYEHTYGTIVIAMAAAANGVIWAIDSDPKWGGITGFQASGVMWEFLREWSFKNNECGLRIIDFDKILYPQCEYFFQHTLSPDLWESIQASAKKKLEEESGAIEHVRQHWQDIVDGKMPFGFKLEQK